MPSAIDGALGFVGTLGQPVGETGMPSMRVLVSDLVVTLNVRLPDTDTDAVRHRLYTACKSR